MNKIAAWKHVFLDTSFIFDIQKDPARFAKNPNEQKRIILANRMMDIMSRQRDDNSSRCIFYVSAISLAEMLKISGKTAAEEVIGLLSGGDVVIVAFTRASALVMHEIMNKKFPDGKKFEFLKGLSARLQSANPASAWGAVSDDMKICACARTIKRLDAVLTSDINTFVPIAEAFSLPVLGVSENSVPQDLFGDVSTELVVLKPKSRPDPSPRPAKEIVE